MMIAKLKLPSRRRSSIIIVCMLHYDDWLQPEEIQYMAITNMIISEVDEILKCLSDVEVAGDI